MYQVLPEGVAFPKNREDVQAILRYVREANLTLTARAAGTSLAGQTVGSGIILDVSRHMTRILEINPDNRWARVDSGVIRDSLNAAAGKFGLFFAPDPATSNRCMIGGMIGNNSSGSFSLRYGTVRDHVLELETVLANGETAVFRPFSAQELSNEDSSDAALRLTQAVLHVVKQHKEKIAAAFPGPELVRSNAGYALDRLLRFKPFNPEGEDFSLVPLLCGSEGTLAVTTAAKVKLTQVAQEPVLVVPQFDAISAAMYATVAALDEDPSAIELVDDQIIAATRGNPAMERLRFFLTGNPKCFLIIQIDDAGSGNPAEKAKNLAEKLKKHPGVTAVWLETQPERQKAIWELRKAGLGLLMGLSSESKSPTFCEDTAVPVRNLPAYVADFEELLKRYGSSCVFYAHASVGELHLRPVLDLKQPGNIEKMEQMQAEITELVKKYGGTISGEHGDGRARSAFLEQLYGPEIISLFKEIKTIFDPEYRLNPGVIVNPDPFTANLRYTSETVYKDVPAVFQWRKEGSFEENLERCNGAGVCRKLTESGGTMCPSYRATKEERESTRGRANLFRQVFSGAQAEGFSSEALKEALEFCLGCKACKTECPAGVDMTRMKAEFLHGWHREKGVDTGDWLMAHAHKTNGLFRWMPRWLKAAVAGMQNTHLFRKVAGLDLTRKLPVPAPVTYRAAFWKHFKPVQGQPVFLFVDHYTDVYEPDVAKAAQEILELLGYQVQLLRPVTAGRACISLGFLDEAKKLMKKMLDELEIAALFQIPVVGLEPSEVLTVRDDYPDLADQNEMERVNRLSPSLLLFEEFLAERIHPKGLHALKIKPGSSVTIHGHCHAKALQVQGATEAIFRKIGFDTEVLSTGCCGMAGAFGYQEGKAALSLQIGEQTVFPKIRAVEEGTFICAPGFSCRHQIEDGTTRSAFHIAQILLKASRTERGV